MSVYRKALMFACLGLVPLLSSPGGVAAADALVVRHATVIDVVGGTTRTAVTLVVEGDRITSVESDATARVPDGATVVDASGKFVMPGLWDMHVHWYDEEYLPLFTANGVTGIRIMFGVPGHHVWRERISQGTLLGPRLVVSAGMVDGQPPVWPGSIIVTSEQEARAYVTRLKEVRADFIKTYNRVPRDAYFALLDEARRQSIPVAGHLPTTVSAPEAAAAGHRCIEHLDGVLIACSSDEQQLREKSLELERRSIESDASIWSSPESILLTRQILTTYSEEKAEALFRHFKMHDTWHCPTLTVHRSAGLMNDPAFINDPRMKYMPPRIRMMWNPANDFRWKGDTEEAYQSRRRRLEKYSEIVQQMQRAGVGLLAGTDALNPYCFPGFSLHDELALFVNAGLQPIDAIRTATINPARFLGRDNELGSIEPGKLADFVVLSANPLEDIANTRSIVGVVTQGRYYDEKMLYEQLNGAEILANRKSIAAALAKTIADQNVDEAVKQYRQWKRTLPLEYDFNESELNMLGYMLLEKEQHAEAIVILQLNVEMFPDSANTYDSLGEAYMKNGDKEKAIANYRKSLDLNPDNKIAREMLQKLGDKPKDQD
jgi:cytosine/adenosine deaminase-related metal-dependent hydrolase